MIRFFMADCKGSDTPKIVYEILKSLNFVEDFGISPKILRFHLRFQDFSFEISTEFMQRRLTNPSTIYYRYLDLTWARFL